MMIRRLLPLFTFMLLLSAGPIAYAQCPMCRASAESSLKEGSSVAKGLNAGILYLFAAPYLLVGTVGLMWWYKERQNKKKSDSYS